MTDRIVVGSVPRLGWGFASISLSLTFQVGNPPTPLPKEGGGISRIAVIAFVHEGWAVVYGGNDF